MPVLDGTTGPLPGSSEETRKLLIAAATREFAASGVHGASLLAITRQAGQRNRGAVHYHFGSRTGMLVAVLQEHLDFIASRGAELFAHALTQPSDDLVSCFETIVRPAIELSATGSLGCAYLAVLADLADQGPDDHPPEVVDILTRIGGFEVFELIVERMPEMPEILSTERAALIMGFLLKTVADRARTMALQPELVEGNHMREQLATEPFIANVIAMAVGMATAPIPQL